MKRTLTTLALAVGLTFGVATCSSYPTEDKGGFRYDASARNPKNCDPIAGNPHPSCKTTTTTAAP